AGPRSSARAVSMSVSRSGEVNVHPPMFVVAVGVVGPPVGAARLVAAGGGGDQAGGDRAEVGRLPARGVAGRLGRLRGELADPGRGRGEAGRITQYTGVTR